jgi:hypothetical protein
MTKWVWLIDLNTNEYKQMLLTQERIEFFKNNPNFKVEE